MTPQTWQIDSAHSGIHFSVRHLVIAKVRGQFSRWSGALAVPEGDFSRASVEVTIDATSIDTGVADRDAHLRSADFFDVATFPEITFASTGVAKTVDDTFEVTGDLTIKGVTRSVTVEFDYTGTAVDPYGNTRLGLEGKTTVNRKDWGVNWNAALEAGGVLVSEKVTLEFDVSAIRSADA